MNIYKNFTDIINNNYNIPIKSSNQIGGDSTSSSTSVATSPAGSTTVSSSASSTKTPSSTPEEDEKTKIMNYVGLGFCICGILICFIIAFVAYNKFSGGNFPLNQMALARSKAMPQTATFDGKTYTPPPPNNSFERAWKQHDRAVAESMLMSKTPTFSQNTQLNTPFSRESVELSRPTRPAPNLGID